MRIPGGRSLHRVRRWARIVAPGCGLLALCVFYLSACSLPYFAPAHIPATKSAATHTPQPYSSLHYVINGRTVYALDIATGAVRWQASIGDSTLIWQASIWRVTPGVIYLRYDYYSESNITVVTPGIAALRASDGVQLWRRDTRDQPLAASENMAMFFEVEKRVYAIGPAGQELWSWKTSFWVGQALILRDSVLIQAGHNVTVPCSGGGSATMSDASFLYALDPRNGSERWHVERQHQGINIEAVDGGIAYATSIDTNVTGCNPLMTSHLFATRVADGAALWQHDEDRLLEYCHAANHAIYCGDYAHGVQSSIQVFRASDGNLLWQFGGDPVEYASIGVIGPRAVYMSVSYKNNPIGFLVALNPATGDTFWKLQQPQTSLAHPDETVGVFQPFATSNGLIFGRGFHTFDRGREILAREEATSQLKWMSDAYFAASVMFDQGVIYVDLGRRSGDFVVPTGAVVALDAATGVILWKFAPSAS